MSALDRRGTRAIRGSAREAGDELLRVPNKTQPGTRAVRSLSAWPASLSPTRSGPTSPLLPKHPPRPKGRRPPADDRACLRGILFVLKTGGSDGPSEGGQQASPSRRPLSRFCWAL